MMMANSKGKNKYFDTSIKILSQEMIMSNMKACIFIIFLWKMFILKKKNVKYQGQKV